MPDKQGKLVMDENTQWQPIEPIEPTTPVVPEYAKQYVGEYPPTHDESTTPDPQYGTDYIGILPPPPPPLRKSHTMLWLLSFSALLLFGASGFFYWTYTYHVDMTKPTPIVRFIKMTVSAVPTHVPTPAPTIIVKTPTSPPAITVIVETPTPAPTFQDGGPTTVGSDARDIFYRLQAQLLPPHSLVAGGYDTDWKNWPYTPERSAFWWKDNGVLYEVAAFGSPGNMSVSNQEAVADANYSSAIQGNKFDDAVDGSCMILTSGKFYCCPAADDPYYYALAGDPGCQ